MGTPKAWKIRELFNALEISSPDVLARPGDDDYDKIVASYANDEYGPDE